VFVREKHINGYTYLYLVESIREDGRAKQRIIKNLGRKEAVVASGELERLATSIGRYGERTIVLSQLEAGKLDGLRCKRIGAPLLFGLRQVGLEDSQPFTPLCVERAGGKDTQLWIKEVKTAGRRYIVCRNEAEATKDAADRRAIVAALERQLKRGDKSLIGNSAYRRYLRAATGRRAFEIDPGRLADEARFDGIFVLRSNARISPLQAVLRYRDLIQVEQLFRTAKALMRTRPIYHSSDAAIRGHVFCSFLALVLRKELDERCHAVGFRPEWGDVLRDLDRLQEIELNKDGRQIIIRAPATGVIGTLFKATRIALPANIREAA